ncbi:MAG: TonB-dependent receptor plug domain-containing protein, partial [Gemmatimonadota bacterium]
MRAKTICCALLLALLVPLSLQAQATGQITGMVQSGDGEPLSGVAVTVTGTQLSGVTGTSGRYTITNVPAGTHTVQAEYLGYSPVQLAVNVTAGGTAVVNFQLQSRAIGLDEIVVIGYGTQRAENITGAIETVSEDEFVEGPARDAAEMLAGKVAGLSVQMPSGNPRAGSEINIRGITSVQGSNNPLILIDGIPGGLETVAAEDIQSVSVLKDGSAAAIYGTRGSGGVILITTKRHEGGTPTLRYDGYISQSTLYNSPDFLTAADYRALLADGTVAACTETLINDCYTDFGYTTDWRDELLRSPISMRHNLTMSGGAPSTNYTASLTYEDAQGIFERSENEEITARANIRHSMFDGKFEAEANVVSRTEVGFIGPSFNGAWRQALIRNPTDQIMDAAGNWQERGGYVYTNPVGLIMEE